MMSRSFQAAIRRIELSTKTTVEWIGMRSDSVDHIEFELRDGSRKTHRVVIPVQRVCDSDFDIGQFASSELLRQEAGKGCGK